MKKLISLLFAAFAFFSLSFNNAHHFAGRWMGIADGDTGYFVFNADSSVLMQSQEGNLGGPDFLFKGKAATLTYQINDKTMPMSIDFIVKVKDYEYELRMPGIYEFQGPDKIRMILDMEGGDRPKAFPAKAHPDEIILLRVAGNR